MMLPHHNGFTALFRDHPGELAPEENFWTLWCKERLTEAGTATIRLGATQSRLTRAHLHHPRFFTGRVPFLPPNQQCQITAMMLHRQKYGKNQELMDLTKYCHH